MSRARITGKIDDRSDGTKEALDSSLDTVDIVRLLMLVELFAECG